MALIKKQDTNSMIVLLAAVMVVLSCTSDMVVRRGSIQAGGEKKEVIITDNDFQTLSTSSSGADRDNDLHDISLLSAGEVKEHCYDVIDCTLESCKHDCRVTHFKEELAYCQNGDRCCCKFILEPFHEADNSGPGDDLVVVR